MHIAHFSNLCVSSAFIAMPHCCHHYRQHQSIGPEKVSSGPSQNLPIQKELESKGCVRKRFAFVFNFCLDLSLFVLNHPQQITGSC